MNSKTIIPTFMILALGYALPLSAKDAKKDNFYAGLMSQYSQGMIQTGPSFGYSRALGEKLHLNLDASAIVGKKKINEVVDNQPSNIFPHGYNTVLNADGTLANLSLGAGLGVDVNKKKNVEVGLEGNVAAQFNSLKNKTLQEGVVYDENIVDPSPANPVKNSTGTNLLGKAGLYLKIKLDNIAIKISGFYQGMLHNGTKVLRADENSPLNQVYVPFNSNGMGALINLQFRI